MAAEKREIAAAEARLAAGEPALPRIQVIGFVLIALYYLNILIGILGG